MRALFKVIFQILVIVSFMSLSFIYSIFVRDRLRRRRFYTRYIQLSAKLSLLAVGTKLNVKNAPPPGKNYLIVCNHTGFIDIFALASRCPTLFVTSTDMRDTPGLGLLTEMGGCLYVDRQNRSQIHEEILVIREALTQGFNVVLYPEAMSTSGEKIYPFKKTLMTAAAGTGIEILPAVVNFKKVNSEPMSDKWRDSVFWYGPISIVKPAWRAYGLKSIEVDLEFLTPIICETEDARREVSAQAQKAIEEKYIPIPFPQS